jgi:hypothetical protein
MIKILTLDDWDELSSTIKKLPYHRIAQTRQTVSEEEFLRYTHNILKRDTTTVYGYYRDGELTSTISTAPISVMPSYGIYNWRNLKPDNIYNPVKNGWSSLWMHLLTEQENQSRYTFYMLRTTDINRLSYKKYHNIYMKNVPKFLNYERTVEEVVPAGQRTKWSFFDSILYFGKPLDHETMVLKFTLKQKFRNNVDTALQEGLTMI